MTGALRRGSNPLALQSYGRIYNAILDDGSNPNKHVSPIDHDKKSSHNAAQNQNPPSPTTPQTSTQQGLSNLALPSFCSLEPVRMALVIQHSLVDLFLRIQNEGAILHNFLVEREAGDEDC